MNITKPLLLHKTIIRILTAIVAIFVIAFSSFGYSFAASHETLAEGESMTNMITSPEYDQIESIIEDKGLLSSHSDTNQSEETSLAQETNCSATVYYFEYTNYDDPDANMVEPGLRLLGTRTLDGLYEGQVLNAWDYVVDIPGHFFFDGWPFNLTISSDPSQNTFELFYMKLWQYEYTVNYYMMTGANLQADNWTDALAPDDVKFTKLGSETFEGQRYDALIEGDAYEYMLDGMYVIDSYPAQIRLGLDPDNNVLNVLYTPTSTTLPDQFIVPDGIEGNPPSDGTDIILPGDETYDKDGLIAVLPDEIEVDTSQNVGSEGSSTDDPMEDFIGSDADQAGTVITDEMLGNTISPEEANKVLDAYKDARDLKGMAQTGDDTLNMFWAFFGVALSAACIALLAFFRIGVKTS